MRTLSIWRRWYQTTLSLGRTPLIKFPVRRTPDGQALITLSIDKFATPKLTTSPDKQGPVVDLPFSYGRLLPISEEEISVINLGGAK